MEGVFQKLFCSVPDKLFLVFLVLVERGYWQVTLVCHVHRRDNSLCSKIKQNYNQEKVQVQINICQITFYCHNKGSTHRSVWKQKKMAHSGSERCADQAVDGSLVTISHNCNQLINKLQSVGQLQSVAINCNQLIFKNRNSKFWSDMIDTLVMINILNRSKQLVADKGIVIGPWKAFQKRHDQKVQSFWYFRLAQDKILTLERFWIKVQKFKFLTKKGHFSTI